MRRYLTFVLWAVPVFAQRPGPADAKAFMDRAETELLKLGVFAERAGWVQETYITDDTEQLSADANDRLIARTTELVNESKRFDAVQLSPELRRKFLLLRLSLTMPAPANPQLREELTKVAASLGASYGKGKYCPVARKSRASASTIWKSNWSRFATP